jgi:hypothetical protein
MVPDGSFLKMAFGFQDAEEVAYWVLDTMGNLSLEREFSVEHAIEELLLSQVSEGGRLVLYYRDDTEGKLYMLDPTGSVLGEGELSLSGVYGFCGGVAYGEVASGPPFHPVYKRWVNFSNPDQWGRDGIDGDGGGFFGGIGGGTPTLNMVFAYVFEFEGGWYFGLKRWEDLPWNPGGYDGGPQGDKMALDWGLLGVYPNPVVKSLRFGLMMPGRAKVGLSVYDVAGRRIKGRDYGPVGPGRVVLELDTGDMPQGVYFYRLEVMSRRYQGKFSVLR